MRKSSICFPNGESELKIQRKLNLARTQTLNRCAKSSDRRRARTKYGIDLKNIWMIEQIEKFSDDVEVPGLAKWKIFQNPEIHIY